MQNLARRATGGGPADIETEGLCLLSLDGGGVRGLSALYILKNIMDRLNYVRSQRGADQVKPCEIFDLIGGTSTGGLIAIMLGRLEMTVDQCIETYIEFLRDIFGKPIRKMSWSTSGKIKPRFQSSELRKAVEKVIARSQSASPDDYFDNGASRGCHVFVNAASTAIYGITRLRTYKLPEKPEFLNPTICEAALATSAATSLFEPVNIGSQQFVDAALGANNPVDEVEREASDIWCPETGDLKNHVKCFVSIGTGKLQAKPVADKAYEFLTKTLIHIAIEAEQTAAKFISRWRQHYDSKKYFRFNVEQGLQNVGVKEYEQEGAIVTATSQYLDNQAIVFFVRNCAQNLALKQKKASYTLEKDLRSQVTPEDQKCLSNTSQNVINSADTWMATIANSFVAKQIMQSYRDDRNLKRVRIAILDTGYDAGSLFFQARPRTLRISMWKDLVGGQFEAIDSDGHGTHVLSLGMKIAPGADVCVVRVASSTEDLAQSATRIADAIEWATNPELGNADIVSMSFGFAKEPYVEGISVISNAIHKAILDRHGHVLFFAATANDGANQPKMFPARHPNVIPIRATNHLGSFQNFNPAQESSEPYMFGTLGTDVPGAGLSTHDGEVRQTGVSMATPIAAGIAAMILLYARSIYAQNDQSLDVAKLGTMAGMRSVLRKLSTKVTNRHYYIYPHDFFLKMKDSERISLLIEALRVA